EPPPARAPLATPWTRWLRRDRSLSNAAALAYGFVLAACLGWGLSNWMSLHELEAEVARTELLVPADPQTSLAPDQYRPASFSEDESPEPWR
ncbi:MAG: hypothetical protein KC656_34275, partial [Myxococcales bacterium]|nr:hypothetical protein [Myxococcales bacterium]